MKFLIDLLTAPVTMPLKGLVWVAEKVAEQADDQIYDENRIRGQLMELELQVDLGDIDEEEYMKAEEILLDRLRIARERKVAGYKA
jgi:hypothetical protein